MPFSPSNPRLDELLALRGLFPDASAAARAVLAGQVRSGDQVLSHPGQRLASDTPLQVAAPRRFVSRGGEKLAGALDAFKFSPLGLRCLDVGASTGGFTDCLLQRGAADAVCVDVGRAQLHARLRADPRVTNIERVNARELAAAARAAGVVLMPAHCMRFWPGWDWLKDAVATGRHGAVQSAVFTRVGAQPPSPFYHDGAAAGGAHLDLHIHDADFVLHLFGKPSNVAAQGWRGASGAIEHTLARYRFDALPGALVAAEGAWTRDAEKRPFVMRYAVRFERASATYEFGEPPALTLYEAGKPPAPVPLDAALGYEREVAEFVRCAAAGTESAIVPATAGADALALVESELLSIELGFPVPHE